MYKTFFTIFSCCILLGFQSLFAQDYNPLPRDLTQLYQFETLGSADTWFFAARIDSVAFEAGDSAYYLYRISRPPQPGDLQVDCGGASVANAGHGFLLDQDHYFGQKMLLSSTGLCRFISSAGDLFEIESQANIGTSWTWNAGVTAQVDSILYQNVLGQMDSVKYINLSNGKQIQLSQHYGMVHAFPFLPAYSNGQLDPIQYVLWGIPENAMGGHLPTAKEILSRDAGDRFQSFSRFWNNIWGGGNETYSESNVVQSQLGPNGIDYTGNSERLQIIIPNNAGPDSTYTYYGLSSITVDTTIYPELLLLPYEDNADDTLYMLQMGIRQQQGFHDRIQFDYSYLDAHDACANWLFLFENTTEYSLADGLGEIYRYDSQFEESTTKNLRCYQKGAESYGNCLDLGTLISTLAELNGLLEIYPNPTDQGLQLSFSADMPSIETNISVFATDGRKLFDTEIHPSGDRYEIPTASFPQGIYMLHLEQAGSKPLTKRFVVQH